MHSLAGCRTPLEQSQQPAQFHAQHARATDCMQIERQLCCNLGATHTAFRGAREVNVREPCYLQQ
jgi:hypothetical protein